MCNKRETNVTYIVIIVLFLATILWLSEDREKWHVQAIHSNNALKTYQRANGRIPTKKNMSEERKVILTVCAELPTPPSILYAINLHEWGVPYMESGMHKWYGTWDEKLGQTKSRAIWLQKVSADWIEADTDRRDAFLKYCAKRNDAPRIENWLVGVRHYLKKYDEASHGN